MMKASPELQQNTLVNSIDIAQNAVRIAGRRSDGMAPIDKQDPCGILASGNVSPPLAPADQSMPACSIELDRLHLCLEQVSTDNHPRTARLLAAGIRKAAQKVIEEAGELALEAVRHRRGNAVRESADLLYHLVVLWRRAGIDPGEVWNEMRRRADAAGIAEKLPRSSRRNPARSKR